MRIFTLINERRCINLSYDAHNNVSRTFVYVFAGLFISKKIEVHNTLSRRRKAFYRPCKSFFTYYSLDNKTSCNYDVIIDVLNLKHLQLY